MASKHLEQLQKFLNKSHISYTFLRRPQPSCLLSWKLNSPCLLQQLMNNLSLFLKQTHMNLTESPSYLKNTNIWQNLQVHKLLILNTHSYLWWSSHLRYTLLTKEPNDHVGLKITWAFTPMQQKRQFTLRV